MADARYAFEAGRLVERAAVARRRSRGGIPRGVAGASVAGAGASGRCDRPAHPRRGRRGVAASGRPRSASRASRSRSSIGRATTIGACRRASSRPASRTSRAPSARCSRRPASTSASAARWARPATSSPTAPASRPKVVRWWAMQAEEGAFSATREVDELRLALAGGGRRPAHPRHRSRGPRALRARRRRRRAPCSSFARASAGRRSTWNGDDRERPLDACGIEQADELVRLLSRFEVGSIVSADIRRCTATRPAAGRCPRARGPAEPLLSRGRLSRARGGGGGPGPRGSATPSTTRSPAARARSSPTWSERMARADDYLDPRPVRAQGLDLGAEPRRRRAARRRRLPRVAAASGLPAARGR